jgi:hypothetical protein
MCVVQRSQKQKRESETENATRREKNARDTISFFMFFFLTPLLCGDAMSVLFFFFFFGLVF